MKKRHLRPSIQRSIEISAFITMVCLAMVNDFEMRCLPVMIAGIAYVVGAGYILAKYGNYKTEL